MLERCLRPGRIGRLMLPHRLLMGSMHLGIESRADGEALAAFYAERARGGAALIVTGGSAVSRVGAGGRHYSFINEPDEQPKLHRVAQAVHEAGGHIALQLFHAGRYASPNAFGLQPIAPSPVPSRFSKTTPRAMSAQDIECAIDEFASGARQGRELGFDAVEVMGSEGYLLNQFLSPLTNLRDDEWGGDFARRTRFPLAVLSAIRAAVGVDFPVIYRLSGADLMPGSSTDEQACEFARLAAERGADALDVGIGWHESQIPTVQYTVAPAAWARQAARIKQAVGPTPVIASTRIPTPELAEQVLRQSSADFVALARAFLADPQIVEKSRAGQTDRVNICVACNQACIDRSLTDRAVSCMVNPRAGRELDLPVPARVRRRGWLAVVGGGPAGLEAARVLAEAGQRVVLFEAQGKLGGQFRLASRVPGKGDYARTIEYFETELRRLGVEIRTGCSVEPKALDALDGAFAVVIATGVHPRSPDLEGIELPQVRRYSEALLEACPEPGPVAVIGAGGIGVDVAHYFSHGGCRVTLMRRGAPIGEHIGRSTRWVLLRGLRERGVQMLTGMRYERICPQGVWVADGHGERRLIEAVRVVIAAGQEPHDPLSAQLERAGKTCRVVGGARLAGELDAVRAFREGAEAAYDLLGL